MSQLILPLLLACAADVFALTAFAPGPRAAAAGAGAAEPGVTTALLAAAPAPAFAGSAPRRHAALSQRVTRAAAYGLRYTVYAESVGSPAVAPGSLVPARAPLPATTEDAASPAQDPPPSIQGILKQIRGADVGQLAVSEEDGRLLRVLIASSRAKRALEIGSASGYSAIWIGLGLRETGGRLTTIEYDAGRAREAAANVKRAGLADIVQVIQGDAFKEIPKLAGTVDFVFLDAWKKDYKRFLDLVLPRLDAGGLFLAHNVVNKRDEMGDFLAAIQQNPALLTAIVTPSGEGVSITWKKR